MVTSTDIVPAAMGGADDAQLLRSLGALRRVRRHAAAQGRGPDFHLEYFFTSEGIYRRLVIDGSDVTYTHNTGLSAQVDPRANVPHWTEADLRTANAKLSDADLAGLKDAIERSRLLDLKGEYGQTSGRAYASTI